jgi:nucleotide-binding universal stress UspA family protein
MRLIRGFGVASDNKWARTDKSLPMTYKTILLHVNDERRATGLIEVAAILSTQHDAHLIGLYVMPPIPAYGANAIGAGYIESGLATFRAEAGRLRKAFEAECKTRSLSAEWRMIDSKHERVAECVMQHGRAADLIIASQRDWSWDFSTVLDDPNDLPSKVDGQCW